MALTDTQITALKLLNPEIEYLEIEDACTINHGNWTLFYKWNHQRKWRRANLFMHRHPYQLQQSVLEIIGKKNVSIR
jgi:hypothetical protein